MWVKKQASRIMSKNLQDQSSVVVDDKPKGRNASIENSKLKFITWNIDGLSDDFMELRTKAVCQRIKEEDADVVFLQEVILESAMILEQELDNYILESAFDTEHYFVATLLKKSTMKLERHGIISYTSTEMGRNILRTYAKFQDISLSLLNTHLESCGPAWKERMKQLSIGFRIMKSEHDNSTVIFAGDMNLRDRELKRIGGLPHGIQDVWTTCGSNHAYSYTWDMSLNTNLSFDGKPKPKLRFDRVYFSPSYPIRLKPNHFSLIGQEKLPCNYFPSDHWGILCHFELQVGQPDDVKSSTSKVTKYYSVGELTSRLDSLPIK